MNPVLEVCQPFSPRTRNVCYSIYISHLTENLSYTGVTVTRASIQVIEYFFLKLTDFKIF